MHWQLVDAVRLNAQPFPRHGRLPLGVAEVADAWTRARRVIVGGVLARLRTRPEYFEPDPPPASPNAPRLPGPSPDAAPMWRPGGKRQFGPMLAVTEARSGRVP